MCGIAGVLFFEPAAPGRAAAAAARMRAALAHRGPDGSGAWEASTATGGQVAFAHTRLAILDPTSGAAQPMLESGGGAITYNGEAYNFAAVAGELEREGWSPRSRSDTEVVLAAWMRWGPDGLSKLRGMFAFGLWDAARQTLVLARDRLGIKPLYCSRTPRGLVFASEVRALLASGLVRPELDAPSLWHYLGYQTTPTPATLVAGVEMLPPGHVLEVDAGGRAGGGRRYWDLFDAADPEAAHATPEQARRAVRTRLEAAVAAHLVSDVPVGLFLSGGLDSGAIASIAASAQPGLASFTVVSTGAGFDESAEARRIAAAFGTEHTEIRLPEPELVDLVPEALAALDHPSGDGVNTWIVARAVRRAGFKAALSGLGGDEFFGGYPSFRRFDRLRHARGVWRRLPAGVRRAAAGVIRGVGGGSVAGEKTAAILAGRGEVAEAWPVFRQVFPPDARRALVAPPWRPPAGAPDAYDGLLLAAADRAGGRGLWSQVSYAEARGYMHDVLLRDTDQMSMAHGLEVRVPLLDHPLVEYLMGLPDAVKRGANGPKALLAGSLAAPLPDRIATRPKRGFTLPFARWLRGGLRAFAEAQLGPHGLAGRGVVDGGAVMDLWRRFVAGDARVTWARVWTLVALNHWMERTGVGAPRG